MEARRKLITAAAVHQETNLKPGTLYRMVQEGLVPCYRTGVKGADYDSTLRRSCRPYGSQPRQGRRFRRRIRRQCESEITKGKGA